MIDAGGCRIKSDMPSLQVSELKDAIRAIPDFPKKGILFRDITPLLNDPEKFRDCIDRFVSITKEKIDCVVSIESRGFIFGSALAYALGAGFVPIRKEGKLPHKKHTKSYDLEYGTASIEIHEDALAGGSKVILIDDVLATGGTVEASIHLVEKLGADIYGLYFLIDLPALKGRERLKKYPVHTLISF